MNRNILCLEAHIFSCEVRKGRSDSPRLCCREWPVRGMSRGQIWLVSTFTTEQGSPGHEHRFHPKGLSHVDSGLGRRRKHEYKLLCVHMWGVCGICVMYVCDVCDLCVWCVCFVCGMYMCVMCVWRVCGMHVRCVMCVCGVCVFVWYVCVGCVMCMCDLCVCCVCVMCVCMMCDVYVHGVCYVCDLCICGVCVWCPISVCVIYVCVYDVCVHDVCYVCDLSIPYRRGSSTYSKFICKCEKWNTVLAFHILFLFWPL